MRDFLLAAVEGGRSLAPAREALGGVHPDGRMDRLLIGETAGGTAFDGIGVFGDRLVRIPAEAARARGAGRGNYVLARIGPGAVTVELDPLGYYPLHLHRAPGLVCVGNRAGQVAALARLHGAEAARDVTAHAWFTLQGSAVGFPSAHRDVALLPLGTRLEIDAANRAALPRRTAREILYADRPLPELLDEAAAEILGNLRALAHGGFDHRVCDLTGGMDSRLVAAAVIHDRLQDAFLFHTIGGHPNPDANVAGLIRRRFGLRRGTAIHPAPDRQRTPYEWLRTTLGETSGLMSTFFKVAPAGPEPSRHLWIGGGSGELLREFWASGGGPAPGLLARLLGRRPSPLAEKAARIRERPSLLRPDRLEEAAATLEAFARASLAEGVAPEHVGDHLYLASRARYHFGVFWATSPRARFHPLYSPAGLRAAHAVPNEDKAANRVGLELMRRLAPELVGIPFAGKRWDPRLVPDAPAPVTKRTPPLAEGPEESVSLHPRRKGPARAPDPVEERLRAEGAKPRQVELGRTLAEARPALDLDALRDVFDPDALRALLDRPHAAFGPGDTDDAHRVIGAATWLAHGEIGPGLASAPESA